MVGQGKSHPGLYRRSLFIPAGDEHWVRPDMALPVGAGMEVEARIRYRQPLERAVLYKLEQGVYIDFARPQSAVTAGQFAAAYRGEELFFSGPIA